MRKNDLYTSSSRFNVDCTSPFLIIITITITILIVSLPGFLSLQLVGQLCSTLGMHHWENGQIAIAMQWFRRAGDTTRAKALVEHLMSVEESGRDWDGKIERRVIVLAVNDH